MIANILNLQKTFIVCYIYTEEGWVVQRPWLDAMHDNDYIEEIISTYITADDVLKCTLGIVELLMGAFFLDRKDESHVCFSSLGEKKTIQTFQVLEMSFWMNGCDDAAADDDDSKMMTNFGGNQTTML